MAPGEYIDLRNVEGLNKGLHPKGLQIGVSWPISAQQRQLQAKLKDWSLSHSTPDKELLGPLGLHNDPIVRRILVRLPTKFKAPALQGTPLFFFFYDAANHMALSMGVGGGVAAWGLVREPPKKCQFTAGEMICLNFSKYRKWLVDYLSRLTRCRALIGPWEDGLGPLSSPNHSRVGIQVVNDILFFRTQLNWMPRPRL
ncbi:hypothetical protein CFAM422_005889 [Trichoderma lentiforme]|uniref:Uncharacterized protein n=1 Tax=Trichoderma lentiforme TaxID=1567552 RepID=A0A9P4XGP7_9HYPO|nr:hypothetical protein CFAM422_005889 [Trichoderma lentiforme]